MMMDKPGWPEESLPISDATLNRLILKAREVRQNAYVPYSNFRVGVALLGEDGKIYSGCNIENSSFGLTNCGERTAIFKAVSEGCRKFVAMVLTSDAEELVTPCGACRQVMAEFSPEMPVVLINDQGLKGVVIVSELLPGAFRFNSRAREN